MFRIQPIDEKLFRPCAEMIESCFSEDYMVPNEVKQMDFSELVEFDINQMKSAGSLCFVYLENNKPVGALISVSENGIREVTVVGVVEEARGEGIAKKLLAVVEDTMSEKVLKTKTHSLNVSAMNCYLDYGFMEDRRIKNDRGPGIDTIWFIKNKAIG